MTDKVAETWASSLPNGINHEPTPTARSETENGGRSSTAETIEIDIGDEREVGPALYPPLFENMTLFGYIEDKNGIHYSRNLGRSVSIHDEVYYIFGDTICKDAAGNYVGFTSNTIAYVDNRTEFLKSEYKEIFIDGMVKDFVPLNEAEMSFEKDYPGSRVVFSMFGGAVDIGVVGVVLFHASIESGNGTVEYLGVCQALLTTYADGRIVVDRYPELIFGADEPRIGSLSTLFYKGIIYLWSHRDDGQIILARVPDLRTIEREQYTYWSGSGWVARWQDAQPVLHNIQHGAVIHAELFGKDKPFVFVGVNQQGDSMVLIGAAANVQGPFTLHPFCKALSVNPDSRPINCIYPHLFASDIPKRELMVTWSEQAPDGGVIAAKLKFMIDDAAAFSEAEERRRAAEEQEERQRSLEAQEAYLARMAEEEVWYDEYGYAYYNIDREGNGSAWGRDT